MDPRLLGSTINSFLSFLIKVVTFLFLPLLIFLFSTVYPYLLALKLIPFLLLIFLVFRLLQFIAHNGDAYKNITQFKHLIRTSLIITLFIVQFGITFNLVSYQPHQDRFPFDLHKFAIHQSKKKFILPRYMFSFVVYSLIHDFGIKQVYDGGNNLHSIQALAEIIDCMIIFWEDDIFSLDSGYSTHLFVEERPTEIKYIQAALLKHSGSMKILATVLVRYDLFLLFTEVVLCYMLRKHFRRSSRRPQHQATLNDKPFYRKNLVYFVNGLKHICNLSLSVFIVYNVCSHCVASFFTYKFTQGYRFPPKEYGEINKRFEELKDLESWTYIILFLFLILWIIKTLILLSWESNTIYDRLRSKMLTASEQLYFLVILDCCNQNNLNVQHRVAVQTTRWIIQLMSLHVETAKKRWRNKIKDDLLWKMPCDPTLDDLQQMARHILGAEKNLSNDFSAVLTLVTGDAKNEDITQTLQQEITWKNEYKEDGQHFEKLLSMETVSLTEFNTWLEKTRHDVISLANTLTNAKQVTKGLNKVLSVLFIGATVMAWLKPFNAEAISKHLTLIASIIVPASISLKDFMKDYFQRIFFVYVIHPFDIGDSCIIDGNEMEVLAMGLWTTTFIAVNNDGRLEIIYPNSKLADMKIAKTCNRIWLG